MRGWVMVCAVVALGAGTIAAGGAQAQSVITTVAGGGTVSNPPLANICLPVTAMTMYGGNIYFASCNQIWEETPHGQLTLIAGTGNWGHQGDGGPATKATLNNPESLAFDSNGNLFVADTNNWCVREISGTTGMIQTVTGIGSQVYFPGPAYPAPISEPVAVATDSSGDLFVATFNIPPGISSDEVFEIPSAGGVVNIASDNVRNPNFLSTPPIGLALDGSGNLWIATSTIIFKTALSALGLTPVAGNSTYGNTGNGGRQRAPK